MKTSSIFRSLLGVAFVVAGVNHFRSPEMYLAMMPPWLPAHELLNTISGGAEIAGGLGLLIPRTRRLAAIGLIVLLVAVFPANLHVAFNGWPGTDTPQWLLFARLPFQLVLIAWVIFSCPEAWVRRETDGSTCPYDKLLKPQ